MAENDIGRAGGHRGFSGLRKGQGEDTRTRPILLLEERSVEDLIVL